MAISIRATKRAGVAVAGGGGGGSGASAADYPNSTNTGHSGTLSTGWVQSDFYGSASGAVFTGLDIVCNAPMSFPTSDTGKTFTFRNCRFTDGGVYWLVLNENAVNLVFEDCTFIGMGINNTANDAAINGSNMTLRRCDISQTGDGMKIGSSILVEDTWIHDLTVTASSHNDCVQSLGTAGGGVIGAGATFRHNFMDASNGATCVTLSTGAATDMRDLLFEDNLFACNGFSVTGGYEAGVDDPAKVSNIIYRSNKIKYGSYAPAFTSVDSPVVVVGTLTWYDPIDHGFNILPTNTGHDNYYDPQLGRKITDSDLVVHTGLVSVSDVAVAGGVVAGHWFQGGLIFDTSDVTFNYCRFDGGVNGYYAGIHYPFILNWCTIDTPGAAGSEGIRFQGYTAYRCRVGGNSDGARADGNVSLIECYLRTESQDAADHNDAVQNVGGNGPVNIVRCNGDCRPTNGGGNPNGAIQAADGCIGLQTWTDNYLAGGGYVVRLYENATYDVQGNWILNNSWTFGPASRAVIGPESVTWGTVRPNVLVDALGTNLSTLSAP